MYSNEVKGGALLEVRDYIREEIIKAKGRIVLKEVNEILGAATNGGGVASAFLSLDKEEPTMLTKEMYQKLQKWCIPFLNKEYEDLRRPFNAIEQYKNGCFKQFLQEGHITGKYQHDTVKPRKIKQEY